MVSVTFGDAQAQAVLDALRFAEDNGYGVTNAIERLDAAISGVDLVGPLRMYNFTVNGKLKTMVERGTNQVGTIAHITDSTGRKRYRFVANDGTKPLESTNLDLVKSRIKDRYSVEDLI